MLFVTIYNAATLYFFCYNGKRTTDSYLAFSNCLYESNWIILPIRLQKNFVLMIAHGQKVLFYDGLGLLELNLETFLKVNISKFK